jgi:hypothetical protein
VISVLHSASTSPVFGIDLTFLARVRPKGTRRAPTELDPGLLQLADVARGDAAALLDDQIVADLDVEVAVSPRRRSGTSSWW